MKTRWILTLLLGCAAGWNTQAQVLVNGGQVSVNTGDGTAVRVDGGKVSVKTAKEGQTAVAVGSGQKVINIGSGNVAVNEKGTIDGKPVAQSRKSGSKSRNQPKSDRDDEAFWGEGGFWGEEGEPGTGRRNESAKNSRHPSNRSR